MKFYTATFIFASVVMMTSCATIVDPAEVLAKIAAAKAEVKAYQETAQAQVNSLDSSSGEALKAHYNRTVSAAEESIQATATAGALVRAAIAAETSNACFLNLINGLNDGIEYGGFSISVCVGDNDPSLITVSAETDAAVAELQKVVNGLPQIIINALIGRNAFTEPDAIVARIEELLAEEKAKIEELAAAIIEKNGSATSAWDKQYDSLKTCLAETQTSIQYVNSAVQSQIPVCVKFGNRGARSGLINVAEFFPQLKGRLPF